MADFNPVLNFTQGLQAGQGMMESQRQNQIRSLQQALSGQASMGNFNPATNPNFQRLAALDPDIAAKSLATFQTLDQNRQKAFFLDARQAKRMLESGDIEGFKKLANDRLEMVSQLNGDPSDTLSVLDSVVKGDIPSAISQLSMAEQAGIDAGFLEDPRIMEAKLAKLAKTEAKSDVEKNFARLTGLRKQLEIAQQSGDESQINAANQQLNDFIKLTDKFGPGEQEKANIAADKAARVELSKQAAIASKDAFDGLKTVRSSIGNMTDALTALDRGAETGPIISKLPSFRDSSIELDNIRGRMGLDVVGATTFGALSEAELAFALDTALPTNLEPPALKDWLTRKKGAQQKLAKELMRAATFLGKPGNTIADFLEQETKSGRLKFDESRINESVSDVTQLSDDDLFR